MKTRRVKKSGTPALEGADQNPSSVPRAKTEQADLIEPPRFQLGQARLTIPELLEFMEIVERMRECADAAERETDPPPDHS